MHGLHTLRYEWTKAASPARFAKSFPLVGFCPILLSVAAVAACQDSHLLQQRLALADARPRGAMKVREEPPHAGRRARGPCRAPERIGRCALQSRRLAAFAAYRQRKGLKGEQSMYQARVLQMKHSMRSGNLRPPMCKP